MSRHEQISAALDGELHEPDLKALLNSINSDELDTWRQCALVGDLIRSSDLVNFDNAKVVSSISAMLESEPVVIAPALLNEQRQRKRALALSNWIKPSLVASFGATVLSAVAIYQTLPLNDSQVSLVKANAIQQVDPAQLAVWQEYFQSHQQHALRGGLSGVSPIARSNVSQPEVAIGYTQQPLHEAGLDEWMNVWRQSNTYGDAQVRFVNSSR